MVLAQLEIESVGPRVLGVEIPGLLHPKPNPGAYRNFTTTPGHYRPIEPRVAGWSASVPLAAIETVALQSTVT